jgi:FAD/FMN-containing dehydrogenase
MTSTITADQRRLRAAVRGAVLAPGDPGYAAAAQGWNLAVRQRPAIVVRAAHPADVQAAVRHARTCGLGVAMMATGHGIVTPCDDSGLLLDTSALTEISVDPVAARVRVGAGVRWDALTDALTPHGLTGLPGSSPITGVVGYTLGGGFGWLGRRFGLASHHLLGAEIVTADGVARRVTPDSQPDLLWALGGGTGNFGVVTALEFAVHRLSRVYGGNLYYGIERAADLLECFAGWSADLPEEMTAAATFRAFPSLPTVPEQLRGRRLVALRGVHCGDRPDGVALVDAVRSALGPPVVDTFAEMPVAALPSVSLDPVQPLAAVSHAELLERLTPELIGDLVGLVGPDAVTSFVMLELRTLGGALRGGSGALSPMAHTRANYSLNAIGLTGTGRQESALRRQLRTLEEVLRPHATGDNYVNFLDSRMAGPARVRAAFSDEDFARLVAVKERYDPTNLFRFNRNIPPASCE